MDRERFGECFGVSKETIYRQRRKARHPIPHFKPGDSYRFDPKLVADWFKSKTMG